MDDVDKDALQTAIALRFGVRTACCGCCNNSHLVPFENSKDVLRCSHHFKDVPSDGLCDEFRLKRLRGRAAKMIMFDEVSLVPDKPWRNILT